MTEEDKAKTSDQRQMDYATMTGASRPETMAAQCPKCFKMPGSVCVSSLGRPYRRLHIERWQKAAARKRRKK